MQTIILITHAIGLILSVYLFRTSKRWRYYALMFLLSSGIGVLFYVVVFMQLPGRHELSLYRSLAQAVLVVIVALGLIGENKNA